MKIKIDDCKIGILFGISKWIKFNLFYFFLFNIVVEIGIRLYLNVFSGGNFYNFNLLVKLW